MRTRKGSIMNRTAAYVVVVGLVGLLAYVGSGHASGRYSLHSLNGVYGFSGSGTLFSGTVQAAVVGLNSFDGAGSCKITARLNAGGSVQSLTSKECSYTVNRDGTGSINSTFNEPPFGPFTTDFVFVDGNKELYIVLSDGFGANTVASGVAKRQGPRESD